MPDDQQTGQDAQNNQQSTDTGKTPNSGDDWKMEDLPPTAQAYIKNLRDEAKKTRLEKEAADNARKMAEQQQLVEQGNWKKLAEDRAAELAKLAPYQDQATRYEKAISDTNNQLIQQIPEQMRVLIPAGLSVDQLNAWLIKSMPLLTRKPAPETDAGAGSGGSGTKPATSEAQAMAAMAKQYGYDITPESLAATAKRIEDQRRRPPKKDED